MARNKKRARSRQSLQRGHARKPKLPSKIILIVCEGAKTEPYYFKELKRRWKLHTAQVEIRGKDCGSDPLSVVDHALALRKQRKKDSKSGGMLPYDQVWCVIDRDHHAKLKQALNKAQKNKLHVALSVPCFEVWYLLHYRYSTKPFEYCDELIKELRKELPGGEYDKANPPLQNKSIDVALKNAGLLRKHSEETSSSNPFTDVDLLVATLLQLKPASTR